MEKYSIVNHTLQNFFLETNDTILIIVKYTFRILLKY